MVLVALEAREGFLKLWVAHAVVEFDRTTMVLIISGFSTDLCDLFFKKMRFVVRGFLGVIFFFCWKKKRGWIIEWEAEGSRLLVRALAF